METILFFPDQEEEDDAQYSEDQDVYVRDVKISRQYETDGNVPDPKVNYEPCYE